MADNYLEKRMDDLRAGRLSPRQAAQPRRAALQWAFPARRVLILTDNTADCACEIALGFARSGCRTALFSPVTAFDTAGSVRTRCVVPGDALSLSGAWFELASDWGDIDIVVVMRENPASFGSLPGILEEWRSALANPNPYGGRLITVGVPYGDGCNRLEKWGITANHIEWAAAGDCAPLLRTCQFLALPGSAAICGSVIKIQ